MAGTPPTLNPLGDIIPPAPPAMGSPQWQYDWLMSHNLSILAELVKTNAPDGSVKTDA